MTSQQPRNDIVKLDLPAESGRSGTAESALSLVAALKRLCLLYDQKRLNPEVTEALRRSVLKTENLARQSRNLKFKIPDSRPFDESDS
jgi:hypothetical protein